MNQVVFLGPSLGREPAQSILEASYLPPAIGGDVLRAFLRYEPTAIGIVDGLFEQVPSVRHKEILYVMSQGVRVYGASSIGALRAAELADFGMVGVGQIFDAFVSGAYENDDEVAISHASAEFGWQPTSDALVNLRWGLDLALSRGVVGPATRTAVLEVARAMFYPERTWSGACEGARAGGADAEEIAALLDFVRREQPDRKRDDARAMLSLMRSDAASRRSVSGPSFDFQATEDFHGWLRAVQGEFAAEF